MLATTQFRALESSDVAGCNQSEYLGHLLQLLVAHGDTEWLEDLTVLVRKRVTDILSSERHRDRDK